jgi:triacylglycerol lipase
LKDTTSTPTIVLAHGIFRFDQLVQIFRDSFGIDIGPHYFDGIAEHLRAHGFIVHETDVKFAGRLTDRAADLKTRLEDIFANGANSVHIIAHSMGGLDARLAIADHDTIAERVSCLTTIGTPHLGTTSADRALQLGGRLLMHSLSPVIDLKGFSDLTTTACRAFNERVATREVANNVRYRTVAAVQDLRNVTPLLAATWSQLHFEQGESDGIVPRTSQAWVPAIVSSGRSKFVEQLSCPFPADHLNEVGLWDPAEVLGGVSPSTLKRQVNDFYLELAMSG